jgi:hypothetical protein
MARRILDTALGLLGAAIGGAVGYFAFFWIVQYGFYAGVLPGALIGLGGGLLSRERSWLRGAFLGVAGVVLGLYTEWKFAPFVDDNRVNLGFAFLVTHILEVSPVKLFMLGLGAFFAFWWGRDAIPSPFNQRKVSRPKQSPTVE